MKGTISYLEDIDVYYYHLYGDEAEFKEILDKWYKITCLLKLPNHPVHKNIYFVPQPRLNDFIKHNPEKIIDIESITIEEVMEFISQK